MYGLTNMMSRSRSTLTYRKMDGKWKAWNIMAMYMTCTIFEPNTRETAKRLLLVDGHSSHVNLRFVHLCDVHGILLVEYKTISITRPPPVYKTRVNGIVGGIYPGLIIFTAPPSRKCKLLHSTYAQTSTS